jgi:hypothetical protein
MDADADVPPDRRRDEVARGVTAVAWRRGSHTR